MQDVCKIKVGKGGGGRKKKIIVYVNFNFLAVQIGTVKYCLHQKGELFLSLFFFVFSFFFFFIYSYRGSTENKHSSMCQHRATFHNAIFPFCGRRGMRRGTRGGCALLFPSRPLPGRAVLYFFRQRAKEFCVNCFALRLPCRCRCLPACARYSLHSGARALAWKGQNTASHLLPSKGQSGAGALSVCLSAVIRARPLIILFSFFFFFAFFCPFFFFC